MTIRKGIAGYKTTGPQTTDHEPKDHGSNCRDQFTLKACLVVLWSVVL
ncbi:MAG: hypothetical protein HZA90_22025 [Verrucomicrobia bacterium]|nr:hypothetical protein [Verrucomicrobiota bacterium]